MTTHETKALNELGLALDKERAIRAEQNFPVTTHTPTKNERTELALQLGEAVLRGNWETAYRLKRELANASEREVVAERDALKADLAESKKMLKVAAKRLSGTNIMGEEIEAKTLGRIRALLARLDGKETTR